MARKAKKKLHKMPPLSFVDKLDRLVWEKGMSDEETHLLYQLFGKEAP